MVRRRWFAVGGAAAVAVLVVGFVLSHGISQPDRSLTRVTSAGELTVGLDPSYPPFEVVNGVGELDGLDIALVRELSRRIGVKARFVSVDLGGMYDALVVGKFDVIVGGIVPSRDDEARLAFSRPYFDDGLVTVTGPVARGNVLAVESGSDADVNLPDLRGKLVEFTFRPFDDQDQIHAALDAGLVRGAIVDRVTAATWVGSASALTISPTNLTSVPYVLAVRRGDAALLAAVDRALLSMVDDGYIVSLEQQWLRS